MIGLNGGIDFGTDQVSLVTALSEYCFEHGLIIISTMNHILRFQPPLVITEEEIKNGVTILRNGLRELA